MTPSPDDPRTDLCRAIAYLRGARTQAEVAGQADLDPQTWSLYETGRRVPREAALAKIARGLGCSRLTLEQAVWRFRRARLGGSPVEDLSHMPFGTAEEVAALRHEARACADQVEAFLDKLVVLVVRRGA